MSDATLYGSSAATGEAGDRRVLVNANGEMLVNLAVADIEIGAVELKNGASDARATIDAANTARTTGTVVQVVQVVGADGVVLPAVPEVTTVAEYNITLTNANTEYSQALPANCRKVTFRCRTLAECRYAWITGKVATPAAPWQTLKAAADYGVDGIKSGGTLYFASATAGVVIEVEAWS